jgi:transposase-like protein
MTEIVEEWRRSGGSAAEVAEKEGVSEGTLWRWRKRVGPARLNPTGVTAPMSFLPVQVVGGTSLPEAGPADRTLTVELRSGTRITIPEGFSADALESLLGIVVRAC